MIKITLAVEGMMCVKCEAHMDETVRKALSVEKVLSSHEKKETEILAAEDITDEKLQEVVARVREIIGDQMRVRWKNS